MIFCFFLFVCFLFFFSFLDWKRICFSCTKINCTNLIEPQISQKSEVVPPVNSVTHFIAISAFVYIHMCNWYCDVTLMPDICSQWPTLASSCLSVMWCVAGNFNRLGISGKMTRDRWMCADRITVSGNTPKPKVGRKACNQPNIDKTCGPNLSTSDDLTYRGLFWCQNDALASRLDFRPPCVNWWKRTSCCEVQWCTNTR